jgi:hypothetical protein
MSPISPEELHELLNPRPLNEREARATAEAAAHLIYEVGRSAESGEPGAKENATGMLIDLREAIDAALRKLPLPEAML